MILMLWAILAILAVPSFSHAATYYVATTGNDGNAGTIGSPWATVQHAASTMVAGDTTYVRGGTYTESNIAFTNSGSAGNVITVAAYTGETPILDSGFAAGHAEVRQPIFNINGPDYITIDGLTMRHGGVANVYISYDTVSTNITIIRCTMYDHLRGDNSASVYINPGSDNITIQDNVIHDYINNASSTGAVNGIIIFGTPTYSGSMDITIQNNEIYGNLTSGIYYKHSQASDTTGQTIIKNNLIHTSGAAGGRSVTLTRDNVQFTNNVIYGGNVGITLYISAGTGGGSNCLIRHNTVLANTGIQVSDPEVINTIIRDNIFTSLDYTVGNDDRGIGIWRWTTPDTSNTTVDHNLLYDPGTSNTVNVGGTLYTPTTMPVSVNDRSGMLSGAPTFVDAANHDYTLTAASLGYQVASDSTDMGVDMSVVGVGNGAGGGSTPSVILNPAINFRSEGQINQDLDAVAERLAMIERNLSALDLLMAGQIGLLQRGADAMQAKLDGICRASNAMGGTALTYAGRMRREIPC